MSHSKSEHAPHIEAKPDGIKFGESVHPADIMHERTVRRGITEQVGDLMGTLSMAFEWLRSTGSNQLERVSLATSSGLRHHRARYGSKCECGVPVSAKQF